MKFCKSIIMIFAMIACQTGESQSKKLYIEKTKNNSMENNKMEAKIKTNKGEIVINLEYEKTPLTVANFIGLAEGKIKNNSKNKGEPFYNGLKFHRVIADFMIQGGCPNGNGMGSPGYSFPDEFHVDLKHDSPGVLSMANSGPNTNGSQFFITHKETPWLDGKHSVFGKVVKGQEIVDKIAQDDLIESITIIRSGTAKDFNAEEIFNKSLKEAKDAEKAAKAKIQKELDKLRKGKIVMESGLAYEVLKQGKEKRSPKAEEFVTINCIGKFTDGQVFWQTEPGKPLTHPANGFVPGFSEAVQMMVVGDKWEIIIPSDLGYGANGQGPIPPNATLIFEIELLEISNNNSHDGHNH